MMKILSFVETVYKQTNPTEMGQTIKKREREEEITCHLMKKVRVSENIDWNNGNEEYNKDKNTMQFEADDFDVIDTPIDFGGKRPVRPVRFEADDFDVIDTPIDFGGKRPVRPVRFEADDFDVIDTPIDFGGKRPVRPVRFKAGGKNLFIGGGKRLRTSKVNTLFKEIMSTFEESSCKEIFFKGLNTKVDLVKNGLSNAIQNAMEM